jgi:hypothetical protein
VGTLGVDGGPAYANREVGTGVDVEVEFAFEGDGEEVTGDAMGFIAAGHADEWVGGRGDEDFGKVVEEIC